MPSSPVKYTSRFLLVKTLEQAVVSQKRPAQEIADHRASEHAYFAVNFHDLSSKAGTKMNRRNVKAVYLIRQFLREAK
jgi:hypothetical protein